MTLVKILIPWTLAVYLGFFFVFGEELFTTDFGPEEGSSGFIDGIIDFFDDAFDLVGDIAQFITLGGLTGILPVVVQSVLLLSLGLGWLLVAIGIGRGTAIS